MVAAPTDAPSSTLTPHLVTAAATTTTTAKTSLATTGVPARTMALLGGLLLLGGIVMLWISTSRVARHT